MNKSLSIDVLIEKIYMIEVLSSLTLTENQEVNAYNMYVELLKKPVSPSDQHNMSQIYSLVNDNIEKNKELKEMYSQTLEDIEQRSNNEINDIKHKRAEFEENVFQIIEDVYLKLTD